ncbi:hypothetical protein PENANT_c036G07806 [Penicillium antarcticum]|uniref:Uncharacterized protein n=1 Tax=Penicillium antarcticum TaxID=416450 RepID=A0A1V6PUJ7_9EURO|nr:uncharacterized protein N7508_001953 [Penicillium antarcticum]KAJ5317445.1 hypothetical protein N7508_001953 [Penicillium antarcticum]OQD80397.1 hypothetical protein PENANT_c036G07806 [Penicillium antarcticum]
MQYKSLAFLLLSATALASPAPQASGTDDMDEIPNSILVALQTAIPSSVLAEIMTDPGYVNSAISNAIISSVYPDWYSNVPESAKPYITSALMEESPTAYSSAVAAATSSISGSASGSSTPSMTSSGASSTGVTTSTITSTESSSTADSSDSASSSSASGSASSSTSDGGAAPTGVAMGFAAGAGVLGLALAL